MIPSPRIPRPAMGVALAALFALGGCASLSNVSTSLSTLGGLVTPYKIDIVQGNVVTKEQVQALKPGMARVQVRDILGTPLLTSVFHAQRWDYVFTFRRQGQEPQQRKLALFFKDDQLERIVSDDMPSEAEFVASLDVRRKPETPPVLEATEAQLQAFQAQHNAKPAASAPANAPVTPTSAGATAYPPLEASGPSR